MALFYVPNLASGNVLPEEESQHAVKVLRLQVGDLIEIVDGKGGFYKAKILNPHPKHCGFEITESCLDYCKRKYKLHIAIAPTKNIERLEWFIEKATEIGVDEITPIICRYSERKIIKHERLERVIISASKQSIKAFFPNLNPLCTFDELLKNHSASEKYIAHCYDQEKSLLQNLCKDSKDVLILIGPEGDFSKEEVQSASLRGFTPISLGDSRLRTETAGIVACCTIAINAQK